jgi:hypothetical protein
MLVAMLVLTSESFTFILTVIFTASMMVDGAYFEYCRQSSIYFFFGSHEMLWTLRSVVKVVSVMCHASTSHVYIEKDT